MFQAVTTHLKVTWWGADYLSCFWFPTVYSFLSSTLHHCKNGGLQLMTNELKYYPTIFGTAENYANVTFAILFCLYCCCSYCTYLQHHRWQRSFPCLLYHSINILPFSIPWFISFLALFLLQKNNQCWRSIIYAWTCFCQLNHWWIAD